MVIRLSKSNKSLAQRVCVPLSRLWDCVRVAAEQRGTQRRPPSGERVRREGRRSSRIALVGAGLVMANGLSGAAQAQSLPDPTRPPIGMDAMVPATAPSGPTLQLIRTLDGKRMAIISGQTVKVGGKVGDAVVTRIDEDRVALRGAEGVVVLKLFPDVEKSSAASEKIESKPQAKMPSERAKRKEQK